MKKKAGIAAAIVLAFVVGFAGAAYSHVLVDQTPSCKSVTATFTSFPQGDHTIMLNSGSVHLAGTLHGDHGSVTWDWRTLTRHSGDLYYGFTWTADGGGQAGPFHFNTRPCAPPPTTSTTAPATTSSTERATTTTGGAKETTTSAGPSTTASLIPPTSIVAVPVQVEPDFTG